MTVGDGIPRVLVVEDSLLMAEALCDMLSTHSAKPVGPAPMVAAALRLVEANRIDAAVLDVRLHSDTSLPVCRVLRVRTSTRCGGRHVLAAKAYGRRP